VKDLGRVRLGTGHDRRRVGRFEELSADVEWSETGSFGRRLRKERRLRGSGDVPSRDGGSDDEREKDEPDQADADESAIRPPLGLKTGGSGSRSPHRPMVPARHAIRNAGIRRAR
jgi:hypothetical protein